MWLRDLKNNVKMSELVAAAAKTSTFNGSTINLGTDNLDGVAVLSCGAVSGTSPTLDGKIQDSADGSTWADLSGATFTQLTAAGNEIIRLKNPRQYIRFVGTIGGSSPSFTIAVVALTTAQKLPAT